MFHLVAQIALILLCSATLSDAAERTTEEWLTLVGIPAAVAVVVLALLIWFIIYMVRRQRIKNGKEANKILDSERAGAERQREAEAAHAHRQQLELEEAHRRQLEVELAQRKQMELEMAHRQQLDLEEAARRQHVEMEEARRRQLDIEESRRRQPEMEEARRRQLEAQMIPSPARFVPNNSSFRQENRPLGKNPFGFAESAPEAESRFLVHRTGPESHYRPESTSSIPKAHLHSDSEPRLKPIPPVKPTTYNRTVIPAPDY